MSTPRRLATTLLAIGAFSMLAMSCSSDDDGAAEAPPIETEATVAPEATAADTTDRGHDRHDGCDRDDRRRRRTPVPTA